MTPVFTRSISIWIAVVVIGAFAVSDTMAASLSENPPPGSITLGSNRHNMSSNATHGGVRAAAPPDGTDQICIFCHTPHGAAAEGPLWNRSAPSGSFSLYSGALAINDSYGGGVKAAAQYYTTGEAGAPGGHVYPNGASRLCMSCHDGVTAVNILRNGGAIAMVSTSPALLDPDGSLKGSVAGGDAIGSVIDLSTSHPISFKYDSSVVTMINSAYTVAALPNRYQDPSTLVDTPLDSQSRMQCTTCHDPHLDTSLINGALPPFWRQTTGTDPYIDVCNNCHVTPAYASPPPATHPPL